MSKLRKTTITSVRDAVNLMSAVADKSLYRCDKYQVLDAFTDLILCDRFGLEHNRYGVTDVNGYQIQTVGTYFVLTDLSNRAHRLIFTEREEALEYASTFTHSFVFEETA